MGMADVYLAAYARATGDESAIAIALLWAAMSVALNGRVSGTFVTILRDWAVLAAWAVAP